MGMICHTPCHGGETKPQEGTSSPDVILRDNVAIGGRYCHSVEQMVGRKTVTGKTTKQSDNADESQRLGAIKIQRLLVLICPAGYSAGCCQHGTHGMKDRTCGLQPTASLL